MSLVFTWRLRLLLAGGRTRVTQCREETSSRRCSQRAERLRSLS